MDTTRHDTNENKIDCSLTRRDFLKASAFLGASTAMASQMSFAWDLLNGNVAEAAGEYPLAKPENIIYSICQQCNTQCGIKVKLLNGVIAKIDGSPYSPWNYVPHLSYKTPITETAALDAPLCPKGQAGVQAAYDPYRIVKVLKRAGKRGENKWVTIDFDKAVEEIVNGGKLFANVAGEENRVVEGVKDVYAVRDAKTLKALSDDAAKITAEKDKDKRKALIDKFKVDHAANLGKMIDPDRPDLGPKNNQILYFWGRQKAGRGDFVHRVFGSGLGTTNRHGHTTVCQGSLYFAGKSMTDQWDGSKWTGGSKMYWMGDVASAEFMIFVGASPFEGNYGPTNRVPRITEGLASGRLKFAVIDPRLSKLGSKAWKWMPNKPGTEAAIALAMIQWIIANKRYDAKYLANANQAAATADKEPTWSNGAWLVKVTDGKPGNFVRASELKLVEKKEEEKDGKKTTVFVSLDGKQSFAFDPFVALDSKGTPVLFDPNDTKNVAEGELLVDTKIADVAVKSSLQVLFESSKQKTIQEWADTAGVRARDLEELAFQFTSYGKNAAVDIHRGVSQHTNGYYNVLAWFNLALLIGNYDYRGGQVWPSTYDILGSRAGGPFDLGKMNPDALAPFGTSLIRHEVKYEDSTLYDGKYPAKRNWYPLASDVYQEIIPSAGDGYPYPIKIAFMYMASPVYSLPAGNTWVSILQDVNKLPLLVASDIVIGESSMYADYIFPDVTFLERWEFSGTHPSVTFKVQGVRQPAIAPMTGSVKVYGQEMALQWEALLLALAEKLNLPNFGPNGLGKDVPFTHPDDLYIRMMTNLAFGEQKDGSDAVPDASEEEIKLFLAARKHLPKYVFDEERWKKIAGANWAKLVTVLNRGGRFQEYAKGYPGDGVFPGFFDEPHIIPTGVKFGKQINMYLEKTAGVKYSGTGKSLPGYATYIEPGTTYDGTVLDDGKDGYDLQLITYRDIAQTKSRTAGNAWLLGLLPENYVLMNAADAAKRGLNNGESVKVVSATNTAGEWDLGNGNKRPMTGKVKVVQGMRPGVVAFCLGFGHWAYGGGDVTIDGKMVKGDARRTRGIHANAAMRVDPFLKNTCLVDPVGASAVFYDTMVKIVKA